MLCRQLFQVVTLVRKEFVVFKSTCVADKNTEVHHEVRCFVLLAIDAELIEFVRGLLGKELLKFGVLFLRQVFGDCYNDRATLTIIWVLNIGLL